MNNQRSCEVRKIFPRAEMDFELMIVNQLEFYFGDSNLLCDPFFYNIMDNAGWIYIEDILKFKHFEVLGGSSKKLLDCIAKYPSYILEISKNRCKIRRRLEVRFNMDKLKKSIFVKGLPKDSSMKEVFDYFSAFGFMEFIYFFGKYTVEGFNGKAQVVFCNGAIASYLIHQKYLVYNGQRLDISRYPISKFLIQMTASRLYGGEYEADPHSPGQNWIYDFYPATLATFNRSKNQDIDEEQRLQYADLRINANGARVGEENGMRLESPRYQLVGIPYKNDEEGFLRRLNDHCRAVASWKQKV